MILLPLLLALQAAPPAQEQPPEPVAAPWPDPERQMGQGDALVVAQDKAEARLTMARFADCVVEGSADKVSDVLVRDFRTHEYRNGLRNLSNNNEGCARKVGLRGRLSMGNLAFAAALAESMINRANAPLKSRLAKAAAGKEAPTYAPSDALAMCVARSTPDDVAVLLTSVPGSVVEAESVAKVTNTAGLCNQTAKLEISPTGLRSIIATATYRLLAAQES